MKCWQYNEMRSVFLLLKLTERKERRKLRPLPFLANKAKLDVSYCLPLYVLFIDVSGLITGELRLSYHKQH